MRWLQQRPRSRLIGLLLEFPKTLGIPQRNSIVTLRFSTKPLSPTAAACAPCRPPRSAVPDIGILHWVAGNLRLPGRLCRRWNRDGLDMIAAGLRRDVVAVF